MLFRPTDPQSLDAAATALLRSAAALLSAIILTIFTYCSLRYLEHLPIGYFSVGWTLFFNASQTDFLPGDRERRAAGFCFRRRLNPGWLLGLDLASGVCCVLAFFSLPIQAKMGAVEEERSRYDYAPLVYVVQPDPWRDRACFLLVLLGLLHAGFTCSNWLACIRGRGRAFAFCFSVLSIYVGVSLSLGLLFFLFTWSVVHDPFQAFQMTVIYFAGLCIPGFDWSAVGPFADLSVPSRATGRHRREVRCNHIPRVCYPLSRPNICPNLYC
jgi:hypothetical protein